MHQQFLKLPTDGSVTFAVLGGNIAVLAPAKRSVKADQIVAGRADADLGPKSAQRALEGLSAYRRCCDTSKDHPINFNNTATLVGWSCPRSRNPGPDRSPVQDS